MDAGRGDMPLISLGFRGTNELRQPGSRGDVDILVNNAGIGVCSSRHGSAGEFSKTIALRCTRDCDFHHSTQFLDASKVGQSWLGENRHG